MTVTFEGGKDQIAELARHFCTNQATYSAYKEADARQSLIDPLFMALGWDVRNESHNAPHYREVIPEESLEVDGHRRAPDYTFRVGQTPKFYAEAKQTGVNVKDDPAAAYQLRRYAWSAKLPFSILTSFAQLAVYDCRMRPAESDKAGKGRTAFYTCEEYADRWRELWDVFSREAVWNGSFDQFVQSQRGKRGTSEVDSEFLKEIEGWRDLLARNIALGNPGISQRDLNVAVQRTIDRIVFLRICEDRGIEPYGTLQALTNSGAIYARLGELFHKADGRYNSGLFYFTPERDRGEPPDEITLALAIDDKPLKDILKSLYFPESPYEFSVLPAEILGQVYEQFLGKVIRLTKGGQAKAEEKPEVRKAGGVYYTPGYIVDYIVQNTVGKLLEGKTPKEAARLRIVDPACGSGSFLIGAYRFLLDWHRDWYANEDPQKHSRGRAPVIYQGAGGAWRLTVSEKKRILLNNIYGVDIDAQAVEVTKLSLLLKVLEGESSETISAQLRLFHERALPDLGANIKCGNSLIGPDFYNGRQLSLLDDEEQWRINAFDWKSEFPSVFKTGGFDAVIGNPPYLFITEVPEEMRWSYQQNYRGASYRFDLYGAFVEKAATALLRPGGVFGFIIPHTLLSNDSFRSLRSLLAEETTISQVRDFGPGVFQNAKNETMLLFFQALRPSASSKVEIARTNPKLHPDCIERFVTPQKKWATTQGGPWLVHTSEGATRVVDRMKAATHRLAEFCTANQGLRTGDNAKYLSKVCRGPKWKPAVGGKQISRYGQIPIGLYVLYEPKLLDAPRRLEIFTTAEKIAIQEIRNIRLPRRLVATLDTQQAFCLQSTNVINSRPGSSLDIRYFLGLLNSAAVNFFFRCSFPGNNHVPSNQLLRIPIPVAADKSRHDRMVELVEGMLRLHEKLAAARGGEQQTLIQRQINATDRQIDQLVYELYGLTDAEIAIVEQTSEAATQP
jgi:hypothetical protein